MKHISSFHLFFQPTRCIPFVKYPLEKQTKQK
jgi:hypothetical protein